MASPTSALSERTSTWLSDSRIFTACDRSLERSLTLFIALVRRSRSNSIFLSFPFGITRSKAGNWASIILEINSRPSTLKKRWASPHSYKISLLSLSARSFESSISVFLGKIVLLSSVSFDSLGVVASAKRCPSVATKSIELVFKTNSAPFKKYRVSSPVIANWVREIIKCNSSRGNDTWLVPGGVGTVGKSVFGSVCIFDLNWSAVIVTWSLSPSCLILISVSGSSRTISNNFLAGNVRVPCFLTDALHWLRRPSSKSVARRLITSSLPASTSTFARIGIVFFLSITPWKNFKINYLTLWKAGKNCGLLEGPLWIFLG